MFASLLFFFQHSTATPFVFSREGGRIRTGFWKWQQFKPADWPTAAAVAHQVAGVNVSHADLLGLSPHHNCLSHVHKGPIQKENILCEHQTGRFRYRGSETLGGREEVKRTEVC